MSSRRRLAVARRLPGGCNRAPPDAMPAKGFARPLAQLGSVSAHYQTYRMQLPKMIDIGARCPTKGPVRSTKAAAEEDLARARRCESRQAMLDFVRQLSGSRDQAKGAAKRLAEMDAQLADARGRPNPSSSAFSRGGTSASGEGKVPLLGLSWAILEAIEQKRREHLFQSPPRGPKNRLLGPSWGALGALLGALGAVFGPSWAPLGALLGPPGAILRPRKAIGSEKARMPKLCFCSGI